MRSIWLKDVVGPFLVRQILGVLLLVFFLAVLGVQGINPLDDLNGSFGLGALLCLTLMTPPRRLAIVLTLDGLIFVGLGAYWFVLWLGGYPKALSVGIGFPVAALVLFVAAWKARGGREPLEPQKPQI